MAKTNQTERKNKLDPRTVRGMQEKKKNWQEQIHLLTKGLTEEKLQREAEEQETGTSGRVWTVQGRTGVSGSSDVKGRQRKLPVR